MPAESPDAEDWPSCTGLAQHTLAFVLAGGHGTRLRQLTDGEAKPAVPFGSHFRIIDFTLANCVNSGVRRVAVLTQYKAQSLMRHIQVHWSLDRRFGDFIEAVPAQQRLGESWYAGTADAVRQNLDLVERLRPACVLVLGGDHVYKMDYGKLLADHTASGADVTVACMEVPLEQAASFGVVEVQANRRVVGWQEKPRAPRPMPGSGGRALASMGIYVFNAATLVRVLAADARDPDSSHDFGYDVIPTLVRGGVAVHAHSLRDSAVCAPGQAPYWRDVGTLDAYWEANIELTQAVPACDIFDRAWPIPAAAGSAAPTRFVVADARRRHSELGHSLVGSGCTIGSAVIRHSVVFSDVEIGHGACIDESVLLPGAQIGAGTTLRRCIVGRDCRVPAGLKVGLDGEQDRRRFHVTPLGITLVTADMLAQRPCSAGAADERREHRTEVGPAAEAKLERLFGTQPANGIVAARLGAGIGA